MDFQLIIIALLVLVVGVVIFFNYYYSRAVAVKRVLSKAAITRISDCISGEIAKVAGKVELAGPALIAPLSGRRCAYYYVLVERNSRTDKNSSWNTIIEEEVSGKFVIRDGRHCAQIKANNLKTYLVQDMSYSSGFLEDATEVLEKYLEDHGERSETLLGFNKTLRYKEGILEEGEMIAVVGRGEWKSAGESQLTNLNGPVFVISSTADEAVYLSDDPDTVVAS